MHLPADVGRRTTKTPAGCAVQEMAVAAAPQPVWRDVMDMREAADYLGLSPDSLYRYASQGTVPAFRFGNRWRFKKDLIDRWMDEQSGVPAHPPSRSTPRSKKPPASAK